MTIQMIPLTRKIDGLCAYLVEPDPSKTVTKDFERYKVRKSIAGNYIMVETYIGAVGVIYKEEFFLVLNFDVDSLTCTTRTHVGVVDSFHESLKAQMHFMGYFHGKHLMISECDFRCIPRTDLEIDREAWYACFSRDGIVVFVKV